MQNNSINNQIISKQFDNLSILLCFLCTCIFSFFGYSLMIRQYQFCQKKTSQQQKKLIISSQQVISTHNVQFFGQKSSLQVRKLSQNSRVKINALFFIMEKKINNKKRYSFQILKQFLYFADQSLNSTLNIKNYEYAALVGQEKMHSLLKIMETQLQQTKIWAFLNLKAHKISKRIQEAVLICTDTLQKKQSDYKMQFFSLAKNARRYGESYSNSYKKISSLSIINNHTQKFLKTQKPDQNISRHTEVGSSTDQNTLYASQYHILEQQQPYSYNSYSYCCCMQSVCHCCYGGYQRYNLQDRIQYLKYLEEMAAKMDGRF